MGQNLISIFCLFRDTKKNKKQNNHCFYFRHIYSHICRFIFIFAYNEESRAYWRGRRNKELARNLRFCFKSTNRDDYIYFFQWDPSRIVHFITVNYKKWKKKSSQPFQFQTQFQFETLYMASLFFFKTRLKSRSVHETT